MDEIKLWSIGLSADSMKIAFETRQIISGDTPSLVSYYHIHQGSGIELFSSTTVATAVLGDGSGSFATEPTYIQSTLDIGNRKLQS